MDPLFRLDAILSEFRPLFKSNNFNHFETFVKGLIHTPHRGTMTQIYLSTEQSGTYWSLPKFLSRGIWCVDEVASSLRHQVQTAYPKGVYVYDESHATTDGKAQPGTHFFRNTRYQKRNKNQSKFHYGHEFGAIGWLAETPEGSRLFPLAARMMDPKSEAAKSFSVLKHLCGLMPPGLIIFDRGFNRRKVFTEILSQGHHLLCRAKSNAVFFDIPKRPKHRKRGRPRWYGHRVSIHHLKYRDLIVDGETLSVAEKVVRTKMCAVDVRIVVIRKRPKASQPYRYFCLFTSDLQLCVETVIRHYRNRWQIETAFRDVKENFGFDSYQLRNPKSLNRFVQLSFLAATLTQLAFSGFPPTQAPTETNTDAAPLDLETVVLTLNMHWYQPKYLTRGLMVAYLQHCLHQNYFSLSYDPGQNSKKKLKIPEGAT